jgi:histidinol-phosphate/aromatic aminotransferase/cobyric acid decarboxylase-like protein
VRTQKTRLTIRKFVLNAPNSVFFESDDGYIRLNHNETTGLISPKLAKKIVSEDLHSLSEYPSYEKLHASIAKYAGVSSDMVHTTNGSDDAIPKITRMLFDESAEVILTVPTFPTYERALRIANVPVVVALTVVRSVMKAVMALKRVAKRLVEVLLVITLFSPPMLVE